jgi:transcription antitermination factor NusG
MGKGRDPLDLGGWFILRMASADTLGLFRSLRKAGYRVWTPTDHKTGRKPRTREEYDKEFALMPSYIFAHTDSFDALARMAIVPFGDHPRFTLFRHDNGVPIINDADLAGLRREEERCASIYERWKQKRVKAPQFRAGTDVTLKDGGFEGLAGTVVESRGRFTLVDIPGFAQPIKISSLLLLDDVAEARLSGNDAAAQEAA